MSEQDTQTLYWYVVSDDESWYRAGPHGPYTSEDEAKEMLKFYQRKNRDCRYRIESKLQPKQGE